ncbi:MAG: hypothetical protein ACRDTM_10390 [Micromonosporaceae bacterium]
MAISSEAVEMLKALLGGDFVSVDRHAVQLEQSGGADDWLGLLATAFAMAVHRRFRPDTDVREITRFISAVRQRYDYEGTNDLPPLVGEALVRGALGETELMTDLDQEAAVRAQLILLYAIMSEVTDEHRTAFAAEAVQTAAQSLAG